jgi:hypothetical protein
MNPTAGHASAKAESPLHTGTYTVLYCTEEKQSNTIPVLRTFFVKLDNKKPEKIQES